MIEDLPYRQRRAHPTNLNRIGQTKQFCCHKLDKIASVFIINHVKLIYNQNTQISNRTLLNGVVDQRIGLTKCISL